MKAHRLLIGIFLLISTTTYASQLTQVEYRLLGSSFTVSPTALTVPRGLPTQVNTYVENADLLPGSVTIKSTLRGPSFPGTIPITGEPDEPICLPPFNKAGIHFLEDIRLVFENGTTISAASSTVTINVLEELLVSSVTTRPLTLEEIREKGIQLDESNFQGFMFTVAFTTESGTFNIDFPLITPASEAMPTPRLPILDKSNVLPVLPLLPAFVEPFSVNLETDADFEEPITIPGILVIPGNVAFLNQFFSAFLVVSNEALNGTGLTVRDLTATLSLPPGADALVGDIHKDPPFTSADPEYDNPLRLAKTEDGRLSVLPVMWSGPDGEENTVDDENTLPPQQSGNAEFLVEGVKEGSHIIDIDLKGTLDGLPSGPAAVSGHTRGVVVVRDPDFNLTFIHPDVVRAGERYDLLVQLHNTSKVNANLVHVSLDTRNLSGTRPADDNEITKVIETIPAGESGFVTFRMESLTTGQVTASMMKLEGAEGIVDGKHISLSVGVSEQGIPLSPDTLVLPQVVAKMRDRMDRPDMIFRAMALLGEAYSIANAPYGSLPKDIKYIDQNTVIFRARELIEAAKRWNLSLRLSSDGETEELPRGLLLTLEDFLFDWLGAGAWHNGWDTLHRKSRQARLYTQALASTVFEEAGKNGLSGLLDLQRHWADTETYRNDYLSVAAWSGDADHPVTVSLTDRYDRHLTESRDAEAAIREIPGAELLPFDSTGAGTGDMALVTRLEGSPYTATFTAGAAGTMDIGIVTAGPDGELVQTVYTGVTFTENEVLTAVITPGATDGITLSRSTGETLSSTTAETIPDTPPQVLSIVQVADEPTGETGALSDELIQAAQITGDAAGVFEALNSVHKEVDPWGRVVAVLFDEDVDETTAENALNYHVGDAVITMIPPPDLLDGNVAKTAVRQMGNRMVFVFLRDPVGPFVKREMTIGGISDLNGLTMADTTLQPIIADPELAPGAQVMGRILRADGSPVPNAAITYYHRKRVLGLLCSDFIISQKTADENGAYAFDWIRQDSIECPAEPFRIEAYDPETGAEGTLKLRPFADGERISLDIVVVGKGSVEGTVRNNLSEPLANAAVTLTSEHDGSKYRVYTDQNGHFSIEGIPVGAVGIEVFHESGTARIPVDIESEGTVLQVDPVVFGVGIGNVTGTVQTTDGAPVPNISVYILQENTAFETSGFLDVATADGSGYFQFDRLPEGAYRVRTIDEGSMLIGDVRVVVDADHGPNNPLFVRVVLAGTGTVTGTVLRRVGDTTEPVAGALVVGGKRLVTADDEGRFEITDAPVGQRTIQARDPETGFLGSTEVSIPVAGHRAEDIQIIVEPKGTISGTVYGIDNSPIAGQKVRLILSDPTGDNPLGLISTRSTYTDENGHYQFTFLDFKEYPLTAKYGYDVANATARVSRLAPEITTDLHMVRPTFRVSGWVEDKDGMRVTAKVTLSALGANAVDYLEFDPQAVMVSDPDDGFEFDRIFPGPFVVTAKSFFSSGSYEASASGILTDAQPVREDLRLVLVSNQSYLRGCILDPEGAHIVPILDENGVPYELSVFITSPRLVDQLEQDPMNTNTEGIRVDGSSGCFESSISLPPDFYTVTVSDQRPGSPYRGLTGQTTRIEVKEGEDTVQDVRLLGLGDVAVEVVDSQGNAITGATVKVRRVSYPGGSWTVCISEPTDITPLVLQGLTEGGISVSAVVSTDPNVDVGGREELRGFGGYASGKIIRNSQTVVRVVVDAAGKVSGHLYKPDGITPVPHAQIKIEAGSRTAYDVTDTDGAFSFIGIPAGQFLLTGSDEASAREAVATGMLAEDGETAQVDIVLGMLGMVSGRVLTHDLSTPLPGAEVRLLIHHNEKNFIQATTGMDGTFEFPRIPEGKFTLRASSDEGLSGEQDGRITREGETFVLDVRLGASGEVKGVVRDASGQAVEFADIRLIDATGRERGAQAGSGIAAGTFSVSPVPLGPFTIEARGAGAYDFMGNFDVTVGDGGRATGEISFDGDVVTQHIDFQGTITVGVRVDNTEGASPVALTLNSRGIFGGKMAPTGMDGDIYLFENVPHAPFNVSARQDTPVGTTISASEQIFEDELPLPGDRLVPDIVLTLNDLATIPVRVLDAENRPVAGTHVLLSAGSISRLLGKTDDNGEETFAGVPLDVNFSIDVYLVDGSGIGRFSGVIDDAGKIYTEGGDILDTVNITLDGEQPSILSVTPQDGAGAVPTGSDIIMTFSEPVDPLTLIGCPGGSGEIMPTIRLLSADGTAVISNEAMNPCDDSNVVPTDLTLSDDGLVLTITPREQLKSEVLYSLFVNGGDIGEGGEIIHAVRDRIGHPLTGDFAMSFFTVDDIPPKVVQMSPQEDAVNVSTESVVRITFSEVIDPASVTADTVSVSGPDGQVSGVLDMVLGNKVAVFTPSDDGEHKALLQTDSTYSVHISGVLDPAGNSLQTEDEVLYTFQTLDTIPPVAVMAGAPAGAPATKTFTVQGSTTHTDVASLEFFVNGVLKVIQKTPISAGLYEAEITMPDHNIDVAVRAVDTAGNVGALSDPLTVARTADQPPVVAITSPEPGLVVSPGDTVSISVHAQDDLAVTKVRGAASGAAVNVETFTLAPPKDQAGLTFNITVPDDTVGGDLIFGVTATDSKAQVSGIASITILVDDDTNPQVVIENALDTLVPVGASLVVTVSAQDNASITDMTLAVSELNFQETFTVIPVAASAAHTFTVDVPQDIAAETLTLTADTHDRFGNSASDQITVAVLKPLEIEATAVSGMPVNIDAPSANIGQAISMKRAGKTPDGLTAWFDAVQEEAFVKARAVIIGGLPVTVPWGTVSGAVQVSPNDSTELLPGEAPLQIVPTVNTVITDPVDPLLAGKMITLIGNGFVSGDTSVYLPGAGLTAVDSVSFDGCQAKVTLPEGVTSGMLHMETSGGESKPIAFGGMFGIVATAADGVSEDPMLSSANTGQQVQIVGENLTAGAQLEVTGLDENDTIIMIPLTLQMVSPDETQAYVNLPSNVLSGNAFLRAENGELLAQNAYLQVVPTIGRVLLPESGELLAGNILTITGSGFVPGETAVEFNGNIPVLADVVSNTELSVVLPEDSVQAIRVLTDGGASRRLPVNGDIVITSHAAMGMPASGTVTSANAGQTITIIGSNLDQIDSLTFFSDGALINAPFENVSSDGSNAQIVLPDADLFEIARYILYDIFHFVMLKIVPEIDSIQLNDAGEVVISGSGFTSEYNYILFAGYGLVNASVDSEKRLVASMPEGIEPGVITVVNPNGKRHYMASTEPPVVSIVSPLENDEIREGSEIRVEVDAQDDTGIARVEIFLDGVSVGTDSVAPYEIPITMGMCPDGANRILRAVAINAFGVQAYDEITLSCIDDLEPEVTITSPVQGDRIIAGAPITITAEVYDDYGEGQVAFFMDDQMIGTSTAAPHELTTTMSEGTDGEAVVLKAVVTDAAGQTAENSLTVVRMENMPPVVTLMQPGENTEIIEGAAFVIRADADDDVAVARLDFYVEDTAVGSDLTAPYEISTVMPEGDEGDVTISVVATDNSGLTATDAYTVVRLANQAPSLIITSPQDGQEILTGWSFVIGVTVREDVGVARVEFFVGDESVGIDTRSPYAVTTSLNSGVDGENVVLRVVVLDTFGNQTEETITVVRRNDLPPTISLTAPEAGTEIIDGMTVLITAEAADDLGVTQVEFFVDGDSVGIDQTAPYELGTILTGAGTEGRLVQLGATALDSAAYTVNASNVIVQLIPDPFTTVVGRVIDDTGNSVSGATVVCRDVETTTLSDGTFSIAGISTVNSQIQCIAFTTEQSGHSNLTTINRGGLTDMGDITLVELVANIWTGVSDGNWSDSGNWSAGVVPDIGHHVIIDVPGSYTITLNQDVTVSRLTMSAENATLLLSGRVLTIDNEMVINQGHTILRNSTINGEGKLINKADMRINGRVTVATEFEQQGYIWIEGNTSWGYAQLTTLDAAVNSGTIRLETTSNDYWDRGAYLTISNGELINEGRIEAIRNTGDPRVIEGNLKNRGIVFVESGTTLNLNGSGATFTQENGDLSVDGGLVQNSSHYIMTGGKIIGSGAFRVNGARIHVLDTVTEPSAFRAVGPYSTLVANESKAITIWIEGNTTWGYAQLTTLDAAVNSGTIRMETTSNDYWDRGCYLKIGEGITLTNDETGIIDVKPGAGDTRNINGHLINKGTIDIASDAWLTFNGIFEEDGGDITSRHGISNSQLKISSSPDEEVVLHLVGQNNTIISDNLANVVLMIEGETSNGLSRLTSTTGFTNYGTIRLETTSNDYWDRGAYLTISNGELINEGRIEAIRNTGDPRVIEGNVFNAGAVSIDSNTTLNIDGNYFTNTGQIVSRGGFDVRDTQFINNGEYIVVDHNLIGSTSIYGNMQMGDNNLIVSEISATGNDWLNITGAAEFNGTMILRFLNGYIPDPGSTFNVIGYSSYANSFNTFISSGLPYGLELSPFYSGTRLQVQVLATEIISAGDTSRLIQAIQEAGAVEDGTIIFLEPGTYILNEGVEYGNGLTGFPVVNTHIIIKGDGATVVREDTAASFRIFQVSETGYLELDNMILDGGNTTTDIDLFESGFGGGILNYGQVSLQDVTVQNCVAQCGGALYNAGTCELMNTSMNNNSADEHGGGIFNENGQITILKSQLHANTAWEGGAVFNSAELSIEQSTLHDNSATQDGGAINNDGLIVTLTNCTISGNTAARTGGAIHNRVNSTTIIESSTITANTVENDEEGNTAGISNEEGGTVEIHNTIISDNRTSMNNLSDCCGVLTSSGYNLIEDDTCIINGLIDIIILGMDPLLGPLQDNGGTSPIHALLPGSPAIDAGDSQSYPQEDQTGRLRPIDGDTDGETVPDIGAIEYNPN